MDALLHTGKHLRCAHRHIVHGHIAVIQLGVAQQQVGHQIDDVPAGEVRSGLLAKGLGETLDEILKDIAAVHGADFIRAEVALGGVELLDDQIFAIIPIVNIFASVNTEAIFFDVFIFAGLIIKTPLGHFYSSSIPST